MAHHLEHNKRRKREIIFFIYIFETFSENHAPMELKRFLTSEKLISVFCLSFMAASEAEN